MKSGIGKRAFFIVPILMIILFSAAFSLPVLITYAQQAHTKQEFDLSSLAVSRHAGEEFLDGNEIGRTSGRGPASLRLQDLQVMPSVPAAPVLSGRKVNTFMMVTCMDRVGRTYNPEDGRYQDCLEGSGFSQGTSIFHQSGFKNLQMGIIFQ